MRFISLGALTGLIYIYTHCPEWLVKENTANPMSEKFMMVYNKIPAILLGAIFWSVVLLLVARIITNKYLTIPLFFCIIADFFSLLIYDISFKYLYDLIMLENRTIYMLAVLEHPIEIQEKLEFLYKTISKIISTQNEALLNNTIMLEELKEQLNSLIDKDKLKELNATKIVDYATEILNKHNNNLLDKTEQISLTGKQTTFGIFIGILIFILSSKTCTAHI